MLPEIPNQPIYNEIEAYELIESLKLPDIPEDALGRSLQNQNNNKFSSIMPRRDSMDEQVQEELQDHVVEMTSPKKEDNSQSINDKELDGLLNWAKELPDEEKFQASGSSFFKQGIV